MSFMTERKSKGADEQLQAFLERESKSQQFQRLGHKLTDVCWDICVKASSHSLDYTTKNCLINCVERFIDTSNFIAYRLANIALANNPKEEDLE
ncbi:mitochondrial import inner membrane translocase subunit Tim8 A-like [Osmia bicornis bicornis]|uniref:mitochondrial import inner membrane translocase subunit Tim8 A-like n=1 Tax=Osmia bicornis bicornis TaxID=1437191 RepID=UPI001EAEA516|nr:mitochondrial import inner membrane translocase subunit Tim8 A-like [Osmia bicornis bicornis]XP_029052253.2 mitochondrial import inner membrane translocase subunit Tim8 A-like [Osmia bicornis bicornis]XP_029052254.2 mitochondrial import inner membrane translocase subunit Tim8 A-like [Osmia bicornis bicornis]